jgi:hypothetical protein
MDEEHGTWKERRKVKRRGEGRRSWTAGMDVRIGKVPISSEALALLLPDCLGQFESVLLPSP